MRCIDTHAHLLHEPVGFREIVENGPFDEIWLMDLSGIGSLDGERFASSEELLMWVKQYPEKLKAFGFVDLDRDTPSRVHELLDMGFVGLKPYKQLKPYHDFDYFPIYAEAEKLGMPILFHSGLIAKHDAFDNERKLSFGSCNMRPEYLSSIAEAFPKLSIIQGHVGWPHLEETEQNLYYYPNITCDVSGYRRSIDRMRELFDRRANDGTGRYFNHKFHFATDEFYGSPEHNEHALKIKIFWESYLEFVGDNYYRWGQPDEREKFFYGNAVEFAKGFCNV